MIEVTLLNYLQTQLSTDDVYMEVPATMPASFIVIDRTSHTKTDTGFQTATIAFQSYAGSAAATATLSEQVVDTLIAAPENITNLFEAKLNSEYPYFDTSNKRYRYQAIFQFTYFED